MAKKKDVLLDHDYDGIQELDNDLPPWWLYLFYITIIWGVLYMFYYHFTGIGDSSHEEYMKEINPEWVAEKTEKASFMEKLGSFKSPLKADAKDLTPRLRKEIALEEQRMAELRKLSGEEGIADASELTFQELIKEAMQKAEPADLEKLQNAFPEIWTSIEGGTAPPAETVVPQEEQEQLIALTNAEDLAKGENLFQVNCASCHGKNGEGGIGPNLTDDYWIHGAGINNVARIINVGVPAKGMIAWNRILRPNQVLQVASYVLTLHGTNPDNAKAPQGEKVEYPLPE